MALSEKNHSDKTVSVTQPVVTSTVESACTGDSIADVETIKSVTNSKETNSLGKRESPGEEKFKKREYATSLAKARKLARERKRKRRSNSTRPTIQTVLSRKMSEEDINMLNFYVRRLSSLQSENEVLHKRLAFLVNENMKFLQMGPSKSF